MQAEHLVLDCPPGQMRIDAMIAATATAIVTDAQLATENRDDFAPFEPLGLRIAG